MSKQHPRNDIIDKYVELYKGDYGRSLSPSYKLVTNAIQLFKKNGVKSIIDVGCGRGRLLDILESHEFSVTGTEVIKDLIENDLKLWNIYSVEAHRFASEVGRHDLVLFVDVLDHLSDESEAILALSQAFNVANIAVCVVVNSLSQQRILKYPDMWWVGHISSMNPHGKVCLDKRLGRGVRIIAWKDNVYRSHSKTQPGAENTS
jgi:2-polyprenyl-3-methyl-5-hydroxy-6-metoxy-1,4-benzoquinol methylase